MNTPAYPYRSYNVMLIYEGNSLHDCLLFNTFFKVEFLLSEILVLLYYPIN